MKIVIKTTNSFTIIQLLAAQSASYFLIFQMNKKIVTKRKKKFQVPKST